MKIKIHIFLVLSLLVSSFACNSTKLPLADEVNTPTLKQQQIRFCDLLNNSETFDNKKLKTTAILLIGFEKAFLYDPECVNSKKIVWFEIEDKTLSDKLDRYLQPDSVEYRSKGVIRLKVELSGLFYAKKPIGYGHLNSFDYLFKIEEINNISDVSTDVPYPW